MTAALAAAETTSVGLECSMKKKSCGWGACVYDVMATNTSGIDLPAGYTVRATITYKVINLVNVGSPSQVKTTTYEKAVPRGGLAKGQRVGVGEFTSSPKTPTNASCKATAGP